jgi:hypothetical protein
VTGARVPTLTVLERESTSVSSLPKLIIVHHTHEIMNESLDPEIHPPAHLPAAPSAFHVDPSRSSGRSERCGDCINASSKARAKEGRAFKTAHPDFFKYGVVSERAARDHVRTPQSPTHTPSAARSASSAGRCALRST